MLDMPQDAQPVNKVEHPCTASHAVSQCNVFFVSTKDGGFFSSSLSQKRKQLTLLVSDNCPFCENVLSYMKAESLDIPVKNINDDKEYSKMLIEIGGKRQVPCLIINGKALYESSDIIEWMEKNLR